MKYKVLSAIIAANLLTACGGGGSNNNKEDPIKVVENAPPKIEVISQVTLNENSETTINFSINDPENDPTQVSIESNDNNFSAVIEGGLIKITTNEVNQNIDTSFYVVASDNKNTVKKEVKLSILDDNKASTINFPDQITLNEEESKIFDLQIEDEDSDTLSVSFDYNKSNFELLYDNSSSQLTVKYVGEDITETTRKQFDIIVSDNYNEVVKTVYVTIYPENESPVIAFDSDVVISEGGKKYYKVDINDDNIGKVTYQFNTEINGLNFELIENTRTEGTEEGFANTEYKNYLVVDATDIDISTNIESYLELVVKDTFEGLDEIIEKKRVNLTLLNQLSVESIAMNKKTDLGVSLPEISTEDSALFTIDLMKHSAPWTTHCFSNECGIAGNTNESSSLDLDSNGWVKQLPEANDSPNYTHVKTKVFDMSNSDLDVTRFYVLFEGAGLIKYEEGEKNVELSQPFMDVVDITPDDKTFTISIEKHYEGSNNDYIRNIKVIPDGGYCGNLYTYSTESECDKGFVHFVDAYHYFDFHPKMLNELKDYKVLNISNNLKINNNDYLENNSFFFDEENQKSWVDSKHGIPFSRIINIASYLNQDIAIDMPVKSEFNGNEFQQQQSDSFKNYLISSLSEFNNKVYFSYGNLNEDFSISESDSQLLLNLYNNQFGTFNSIVSENRREELIDNINNNDNLSEEEKAQRIVEINNQEMISSEEKILNIIAVRNKENCDYLSNNSTINFSCDIRGSFNNEVINVMSDTYNEVLLNCDVYREYLKTQPDTIENREYWDVNNCSLFFDSIIIEPVFGFHIDSNDMEVIGTWQEQSQSELYSNMDIEINIDSSFEETGYGALPLFKNKLSKTFNVLNNYDVDVLARNARHNYYTNSENINANQNMIILNTTTDNTIWKDAYKAFLESWITLEGGSLVLFDSVGNYNSKGIRAVQSFEGQNTHQKQAIEEILSENSCWYCK